VAALSCDEQAARQAENRTATTILEIIPDPETLQC
jgi:hypothetical protein